MDGPIPPPHGFTLPAEPPRSDRASADLATRVEELTAKVGHLEHLLAAAHLREQDLTAQLQGERMNSAELATRPEPAGSRELEASLEAAERRADEVTQRAELFERELLAATNELDGSRHRAAELGMLLSSALSEASTAASERARADRVQAERDAARAQAEAERRLTVASQTRASRAEARLAVLESPMLAADRRLAEATKMLRGVLLGSGGDEPDRIVDISDHATLDVDPKTTDGGTGPAW